MNSLRELQLKGLIELKCNPEEIDRLIVKLIDPNFLKISNDVSDELSRKVFESICRENGCLRKSSKFCGMLADEDYIFELSLLIAELESLLVMNVDKKRNRISIMGKHVNIMCKLFIIKKDLMTPIKIYIREIVRIMGLIYPREEMVVNKIFNHYINFSTQVLSHNEFEVMESFNLPDPDEIYASVKQAVMVLSLMREAEKSKNLYWVTSIQGLVGLVTLVISGVIVNLLN